MLISSIREKLTRGELSSRGDTIAARVVAALQTMEPRPHLMFVVEETPEQGEDILTVLLSSSLVVEVEVSRLTNEIVLEQKPISEFLQNASKNRRRTMAIALELLKESSAKSQ
jgi:hypothetical protein